MKIPAGFPRAILLVLAAVALVAAFQACQTAQQPIPTAKYAIEFHYQRPATVSLNNAQQLVTIFTDHHVRGTLKLNGVPVPAPRREIKTDSVAAAPKATPGPVTEGAAWTKTQLSGLLEADRQEDLEAALREFLATSKNAADNR